jgi:MYXO-CTERM domain-containing protein
MPRLALVLSLALSLLPSAATAAPHTVLYRHPSDAKPAFVAGDLSGPTGLGAEAAARAFLRAAPDLVPAPLELIDAASLHHLTDATVVRFALRHAGLPIVDADVVVRLDVRGRVRMVAGHPLRLASAGSPTPTLSAADAQELLASTHAPARAGYVRAVTPRLVWMAAANGGLRLVWEARLPVVPLFAESLLFRVDAHSGALVTARNLVRFADQGKVFLVDPITDGNQTTVATLSDLAPGGSDPPDALFNSLIKVLNCVDKHNTVPVNYGGYNVNVHVCDEVSTVVRSGGDYLQYDPVTTDYTPQTGATEDATACLTSPGCDPFAEINAYWHIMKAYKYFQAFNDPRFAHEKTMPLQVNVNYRQPFDTTSGGFDLANITSPSGKLYGWDNSFFSPPGQLIPGVNRPANVMFFQGVHHDMSYEAGVQYHEFTHSVVWSTSDLLMGPTHDELGLDPSPVALDEAFADTFASFLSGQHVMGTYVFDFNPSSQRDFKDTHLVCPDLLRGEEHRDGQAMSESLWAIRDGLGVDSEKAIFAAVAGLSPDANFTEAVAAVESAISDGLGAAAKDTAHGIFVDHGMVDCRRIINYTQPREILYAAGTSDVGMTPAPGYLQFKYPLAERAASLHVQFNWTAYSRSLMGGSGTPAYSVYVRKGEPVSWTYGMTGASAAGTKDFEFALVAAGQNASFSGELTQVLDPGDWYVQIVATGAAGGVLQSVTITHVPAPQDDAGPPQDDGGAGDDAGDHGGRDSGCGCRTTAPASGGLVALLVLALLIVRRRR